MQLKYFDDPVVRCMQAMDCVESREMADKCEFFSVLPQAVPQFPKVSCYAQIQPANMTDSLVEAKCDVFLYITCFEFNLS